MGFIPKLKRRKDTMKLSRKPNDYWYQEANAKLEALAARLEAILGHRAHIYGASLPAGHSCPMAVDCLTKVDRATGKVTDGKLQEFRCFAATMEAMSPDLRRLVWHNFDILRAAKTREAMLEVLDRSFPADADAMRPGLDGDFFNQSHFNAWMDLARLHPNVRFYAYTKSIGYWAHHMDTEGIPANMELNASEGGRQDALAMAQGFKTAKVVLHPEEADALGLEIDHDESHAINAGPSFALLIHGTQPKGSKQSAALKRMRLEGIKYAYTSKK
jgi:hypothetical protein